MESNPKISQRQKEIIIGKLLGDGHAETQTEGRTYRLKFEHSYKQKEYVDWLYQELKSIASGTPSIKKQSVNGINYMKYWFNTITSSSFRFYAQQFYCNRKKKIPQLIHKWLTPLTLAVWFMDDGSIKSKNHKAKIINTQSFSKEDIERVIKVIADKYGVKSKLRKQKEGYQIYLLSETIDKFEEIIKPYIVPSMKYKLG